MHLVGYLFEAYHDARSLEHKVRHYVLVCVPHSTSHSARINTTPQMIKFGDISTHNTYGPFDFAEKSVTDKMCCCMLIKWVLPRIYAISFLLNLPK